MLRALALSLLLTLPALAATDPWDVPVKVPQGVVYKEDSSKIKTAMQRLERVLAPGYKGNERIFPQLVSCGPFVWPELRRIPKFAGARSTPVKVKVQENLTLPGRAFREKDSGGMTLQVERQLRDWLARDGGFKVRKLHENELSLLWAMIPFDLNDPVVVVESKSHAFVILFSGADGFMLDDFHNASASQFKALAADAENDAPAPMQTKVLADNWDELKKTNAHAIGKKGHRDFAFMQTGNPPNLSADQEAVLKAYLSSFNDAADEVAKKVNPAKGEIVIQLELQAKTLVLQIFCKPGWTAAQRAELRRSLQALPRPQTPIEASMMYVLMVEGGDDAAPTLTPQP